MNGDRRVHALINASAHELIAADPEVWKRLRCGLRLARDRGVSTLLLFAADPNQIRKILKNAFRIALVHSEMHWIIVVQKDVQVRHHF